MRKKLARPVNALTRAHKKWLMVAADVLMIPVALWASFALRLSEIWPQRYFADFGWLLPVTVIAGIFIFARLGLYRAIVRFMNAQAFVAIFKGVLLLALTLWSMAFIFRLGGFPRSVPILFALILFVFIGGSRMAVRSFYQWLTRHYTVKEAVLIYGAGEAGAQLGSALLKGREFLPVAFLDDDPGLWKMAVHGLTVYPPSEVSSLIGKHDVKRVFIAVPGASKSDRKRILELLKPLALHIQTTPSMSEIVAGRARPDQLQEVEPEDVLGRDPIPADVALFNACIEGKVVMVTGAGGSIGSELCRQVLLAKPKALILYEMSEYALYNIDMELKARLGKSKPEVQLIPILGSVVNEPRVNQVIAHYRVETIYHAAAYKHVPLVEQNVFEGIRNNVVGTQIVAEAAKRHKVSHFVLVSTDKAVRPTSMMGASKRLAEQIVQAFAVESQTVFSMVRFGNVLGSSGSVVPLFRQQISEGGPVTVTHRDITRYFMTIPEAASLVIQAGAMAKGGDVFVLDMGEPVKITDLAKRMIELSGYEVRTEQNPEGDIAIQYTGLRPGEKLYEELLIGEGVSGTDHPKIMKAHEEFMPLDSLNALIQGLLAAEQYNDSASVRALLRQAVTGFKPSSHWGDHLGGTGRRITVKPTEIAKNSNKDLH